MKQEKNTRFLGLHVPTAVKELLDHAAKDQTRSVSAQALYYIKQGLKHDGKEIPE